MSVEVNGLDDVLSQIESQLGPQRMQQISDEALISASEVFKSELKNQFGLFKDTGASIDEISLTAPYDKDGIRTITVHWKGPKSRYRVIHLNEFGTVKNPNPRGKGAVARALRNSEAAYKRAVEEALRGALQ